MSWGEGEMVFFLNLYYLVGVFDFTLFIAAFLVKNTQGWVLIYKI